MDDHVHLSDLGLDQLRQATKEGSAHPDHLRHIESCAICRRRLEEMDQLAESVRPELAGLLSRTEKLAEERKSGPWSLAPRWLLVPGAIAIVVLALLWGLPGDKQTGMEGVRIKGGPKLEISSPDTGKDPGQVLRVGQNLHVGLSGTPTPRCLALRDVDKTWRLLWPLKEDAKAEAGDLVELNLEVAAPRGDLVLTAIFGPTPLPEDTALRLVKALQSNPRMNPPKGIKVLSRTFRVVAM